jgi:superfamily II DNA helicase RecQ
VCILAERLQVWLQGGGIIVATSALGTGVDFPGIVYILHVGMPWSMIDYAQESGRGGRSGETVDAVVLVELGEVERGMEQKSEDIDVQAMGLFLIGNGCRRQLMSRYLDTNAVSCQDIESAGCNRCGEGVQKWVDEQESTGAEWNIVERMLDELRQGCAICCMLGEAGSEEWKRHKVMQCLGIEGVDGQQVDRFRQMMRDGGGTHSCRRCWVSQKYCRTGRTGYTVGVPVAERSSTVGASGGRVRSRGYDDQGVWV